MKADMTTMLQLTLPMLCLSVVRATYFICHRLISSWKNDLNTSLAALEMLSGFARISIAEQDALECMKAVNGYVTTLLLIILAPTRTQQEFA